MIAIRKEKSIFPWREVIIFEAKKDEEARFETMFGDKLFWIDEGERTRLTVNKSDCIEVGDAVRFSWIVQKKPNAFAWNWV